MVRLHCTISAAGRTRTSLLAQLLTYLKIDADKNNRTDIEFYQLVHLI
jgi:hypothetical protein